MTACSERGTEVLRDIGRKYQGRTVVFGAEGRQRWVVSARTHVACLRHSLALDIALGVAALEPTVPVPHAQNSVRLSVGVVPLFIDVLLIFEEPPLKTVPLAVTIIPSFEENARAVGSPSPPAVEAGPVLHRIAAEEAAVDIPLIGCAMLQTIHVGSAVLIMVFLLTVMSGETTVPGL